MGEFSGYANGQGVIPGIAGGAREFDGIDDIGEVSGLTDPSMTVAVYGWARIESSPVGEAPIFARSGGMPSEVSAPDNAVDWAITVYGTGTVRALARAAWDVVLPVGTAVVDEGWHHYGIVVRDNQMWFYVDGESSQVLTTPPPIETFVPTLSMGGWYGEAAGFADAAFHGEVDEVMLSYRELSGVWMQTVYANQVAPEGTFELGAPTPE